MILVISKNPHPAESFAEKHLRIRCKPNPDSQSPPYRFILDCKQKGSDLS